MHVAGIIAEYNPFHNGHLYQIQQTRQETGCDFLIVIMSGNFSQRGTATLCDKFVRSQMALSNGADLVLELPVAFATASAERFAHYAVSSLHESRLVDTLSFGSECGNLSLLDEIATLLAAPSAALDTHIRTYLKEGLSFPRAREKAILDQLATSKEAGQLAMLLQNPNNILGIEYLKALKRLNSSITPFTVKRTGTGYHDTHSHEGIASATAIRKQITENVTSYKTCVPSNIHSILEAAKLPDMNLLSQFIHFKLMFSQTEDLYALWDVPKPLLHSLVNCCHSDQNYDQLVATVTSKTYTRSTVQRSLLRLLLDIRTSDMQPLLKDGHAPYLRLLGCRKEATPLLKQLKAKCTVPVITNFARQYRHLDPSCRLLLDHEIRATKLYHYMTGNHHKMGQDFTTPFLLI